jgi:mono/diheme cytochrome c family protein
MRRQIAHLLVAALVVSAGLIGAVTLTAQGASTIARGAEIAPVPLNMKGLNPALVREGSYIVNAQGACNDCHTVPSFAPGGDPFAGQPEVINAPCYLAGGAAFGPFVSRNLTRVPAIRTLDQFKDIMRNGTDYRTPADGTPILQVMPWPVYGKMSDRELAAIYEYLSAIPVINPRPAFCTAPPPA